MTIGQAAWLAALRAALGIVLVGGGALALFLLGRGDDFVLMSWAYMYVTRVVAWWFVGKRFARLTGQRLAGWIVAGMLLNAAFDVAAVAGLTAGWHYLAAMVVVIATFIAILHHFGTRDAVIARFAGVPLCRVCEYNLTGNLSGTCPECGTPIVALA